ncbi:MAG: hypothetical protein M1834_006884 [Cirrosporium novae-zelandiae]|nr:MAG: hypothetical protein M1834_006884 [Cirrosporium novae-zelandiae]
MFRVGKANAKSRRAPVQPSGLRKAADALLHDEPNLPDGFMSRLNSLLGTRDRVGLDREVYDWYRNKMARPDYPLMRTLANEKPDTLLADEVPAGWTQVTDLGQGNFGSTSLWMRDEDDELVVVKDTKFDEEFFKDYNNEGYLTYRLNRAGCPHVINVEDWYTYPDAQQHRLLYEWAEHGDLHNLYSFYWVKGLQIPELFIWHTFYSIANALCFMRYGQNTRKKTKEGWEQILHLDLKMENIFLFSPGETNTFYPTVKVADFGQAYTLPQGKELNAVLNYKSSWIGGTPEWRAPERVNEQAPGSYSDVWALGKLMIELMRPAQKYLEEQLPFEPLGGEHLPYSTKLLDLAFDAFHDDPMQRPDIFGLFQAVRKEYKYHTRQTEATIQANRTAAQPVAFLSHEILYKRQHQDMFNTNSNFANEYREANITVSEMDFDNIVRAISINPIPLYKFPPPAYLEDPDDNPVAPPRIESGHPPVAEARTQNVRDYNPPISALERPLRRRSHVRRRAPPPAYPALEEDPMDWENDLIPPRSRSTRASASSRHHPAYPPPTYRAYSSPKYIPAPRSPLQKSIPATHYWQAREQRRRRQRQQKQEEPYTSQDDQPYASSSHSPASYTEEDYILPNAPINLPQRPSHVRRRPR